MNAITLASSAAFRVGQLVRLLASDKSGEIISAATVLNRTLSRAGTDIHYLAAVVERGLQHAPANVEDESVSVTLRRCRKHFASLNEREQDFILSLERMVHRLGGAFEPSRKQWAWLLSIHDRLRS